MAEIFNVTHEGGNLSEYNSISGPGQFAGSGWAVPTARRRLANRSRAGVQKLLANHK